MSDISPAASATAVTKSDTTELVDVRALYVGGTGDVVIKPVTGPSVTFTAVPGGTILPVRCTKVLAATTATAIVALY